MIVMNIGGSEAGARLLLVTMLTAGALFFSPLAGPVPGVAQEVAPVRGEVAGRVVGADTQAPLAGAVVVLEPQPAGALVGSQGGAAFPASAITAETDEAGAYGFEGLGSGAYVIRVVRLGYRPARIEIELHGAARSRVTLGLVVEPITLEPVQVAVDSRPIMERVPRASEVDARRVRSVEDRQERFLESDVRSMGYTDMLEAVTLGELVRLATDDLRGGGESFALTGSSTP